MIRANYFYLSALLLTSLYAAEDSDFSSGETTRFIAVRDLSIIKKSLIEDFFSIILKKNGIDHPQVSLDPTIFYGTSPDDTDVYYWRDSGKHVLGMDQYAYQLFARSADLSVADRVLIESDVVYALKERNSFVAQYAGSIGFGSAGALLIADIGALTACTEECLDPAVYSSLAAVGIALSVATAYIKRVTRNRLKREALEQACRELGVDDIKQARDDYEKRFSFRASQVESVCGPCRRVKSTGEDHADAKLALFDEIIQQRSRQHENSAALV